MLLTVVIPTRNRSNELEKLVENLYANFKIIEKIVVIDSSDFVNQKYESTQDSRIVYRHTNICSAAIQRNMGIALVPQNCKFLAFLDDDVIPPKEYFEKLINMLTTTADAVGASGITQNPQKPRILKISKVYSLYRYIFFLDSKKEGVVLSSGVNIPYRISLDESSIYISEWLIGCSIWDFQKIKNCLFDSRFYGQSLGEDVLFSLKASKFGKLYVNKDIVLQHLESKIDRPSIFLHSRMWVRNRFYIVEELNSSKIHLAYHWCNLGKLLSVLFFIPTNPKRYVSSAFGILTGYLDLFRGKIEN